MRAYIPFTLAILVIGILALTPATTSNSDSSTNRVGEVAFWRHRSTGYYVGDGVVITAAHIYLPYRSEEPFTFKGKKARLLSYQPDKDLLFLEVFPWGNTPTTFSNPQIGPAYILHLNLSTKKIERKEVTINSLQKDDKGMIIFRGWSPIHGMSGSPIFQKEHLIGIVSKGMVIQPSWMKAFIKGGGKLTPVNLRTNPIHQ